MNRCLAATALALLFAACSKTERSSSVPPPAQPPPAAPSVASKSLLTPIAAAPAAPIAPVLSKPEGPAAPGPIDPPIPSAMRGAASESPIPAPSQKPRVPLARPEKAPMLGSAEPVLDPIGVERIALTPGARAPRPVAKPAVMALPEEQPISAATPAPANTRLPSTPAPSTEPAEPIVETTAAIERAPAPSARISSAPVAAAMSTGSSRPLQSISKPELSLTTINQLVLDSVRAIPPGGEYRADSNAIELLRGSMTVSNNHLQVVPDFARPSFCSGATYLVFLLAADRLHRDHRIELPGTALEALLVCGQHDGQGVWGRWNANGPGTARLFYELGLGRSFTNLKEGLPGDFLKIWWNDEIGAKERGHSVVFLGLEKTESGEPGVRYWSSNKPGGFGEAVAPMSKIKRLLFSRLENPAALAKAAKLPMTDRYLADMLKRASSQDEMLRMCGATAGK